MWNTPDVPGTRARLAVVTETDTVATPVELPLGVRCRRKAGKPQLKMSCVQCQRGRKAGAQIRLKGVGGVTGTGWGLPEETLLKLRPE